MMVHEVIRIDSDSEGDQDNDTVQVIGTQRSQAPLQGSTRQGREGEEHTGDDDVVITNEIHHNRPTFGQRQQTPQHQPPSLHRQSGQVRLHTPDGGMMIPGDIQRLDRSFQNQRVMQQRNSSRINTRSELLRQPQRNPHGLRYYPSEGPARRVRNRLHLPGSHWDYGNHLPREDIYDRGHFDEDDEEERIQDYLQPLLNNIRAAYDPLIRLPDGRFSQVGRGRHGPTEAGVTAMAGLANIFGGFGRGGGDIPRHVMEQIEENERQEFDRRQRSNLGGTAKIEHDLKEKAQSVKSPYTVEIEEDEEYVCVLCGVTLGVGIPDDFQNDNTANLEQLQERNDVKAPYQAVRLITTADRDLSKRIFITKCGHVYCGRCVKNITGIRDVLKNQSMKFNKRENSITNPFVYAPMACVAKGCNKRFTVSKKRRPFNEIFV